MLTDRRTVLALNSAFTISVAEFGSSGSTAQQAAAVEAAVWSLPSAARDAGLATAGGRPETHCWRVGWVVLTYSNLMS